ncbi:MAG: 2'-5' RNA ligase family protein [Candidatus Diapherotrites archaeon]|nr:2'-5' RNA ligase family protein [Candidatus Diapherotrites archaeon]
MIEFRFHGYTKKYLKETIFDVSKKFRVSGVTKKHVVPHISLVGPFQTRNQREVVSKFVNVSKKYGRINFKLSGFRHFDDRVVFVDVESSSELAKYRQDLFKSLEPVIYTTDTDYLEPFAFHSTVAFKDIQHKFDRIFSYLDKQKPKQINQTLLRATLLKGGKILCEYDFIQKRLLKRKEALDKKLMKKTIGILKETKNADITKIPEFTAKESEGKRTFLISDLHLDHANIIKFCKRPFKNVEEMNRALVDNWNKTVSKNDTVYFLGDMAYGKNSRSAKYWLSKLNGKIVFIEGNHEDIGNMKSYTQIILNFGQERFLLIHDPALKPADWQGWVIHGHKHNNDLSGYPYINKKNKTINVSAELVNYTPKRLDEVCKEIGVFEFKIL